MRKVGTAACVRGRWSLALPRLGAIAACLTSESMVVLPTLTDVSCCS